MMKPKIIYILGHVPNPIIYRIPDPEEYKNKISSMEYIHLKYFPFWIGFFRGDFHHKYAVDLANHFDSFQIECWRPYGESIKQSYAADVDGILHRVFPSKSYHIPGLGRFQRSQEMLQAILAENNQAGILIHFYDSHSDFVTWLILEIRKKSKIPIIYQHGGNSLAWFKYTSLPFYLKFRLNYFYAFFKQIKAIKLVNHYYSGSLVEVDLLNKWVNPSKVSFYMNGIDFNYFHPAVNKNDIRRQLGLKSDSIVLLYVGRFYKNTNLNVLLSAYKVVKARFPSLTLLLIGGYKTDELYEDAKKTDALLIERIPTDLLRLYYQASDFAVYPTFEYVIVNFGGLGYGNLESLACGLPVISNNLKHFPGSNEEKRKIGLCVESEIELVEKIIFLITNKENFSECRNIARKYFDIENTIKQLVIKYNQCLYDS